MTANFGGGAIPAAIVVCYGYVVPLLGAIAGCQYLPPIFRATNVTQTPKKITMNFVSSCRRYTVLFIDNTKIGFGYLASMLV